MTTTQKATYTALEVELLEALKWMTEMAGYATYNLKPEWRSQNGGDFDSAIDQARAAIALAEGREASR